MRGDLARSRRLRRGRPNQEAPAAVSTDPTAAKNLTEARRLNDEAGKRLAAIQKRLDVLGAKQKAGIFSSEDSRGKSMPRQEIRIVARMQAEAGLLAKPAAKAQARPKAKAKAKDEARAKAVAKGSARNRRGVGSR